MSHIPAYSTMLLTGVITASLKQRIPKSSENKKKCHTRAGASYPMSYRICKTRFNLLGRRSAAWHSLRSHCCPPIRSGPRPPAGGRAAPGLVLAAKASPPCWAPCSRAQRPGPALGLLWALGHVAAANPVSQEAEHIRHCPAVRIGGTASTDRRSTVGSSQL